MFLNCFVISAQFAAAKAETADSGTTKSKSTKLLTTMVTLYKLHCLTRTDCVVAVQPMISFREWARWTRGIVRMRPNLFKIITLRLVIIIAGR